MRKGLLDILKGKFLVSDDAPKNWRFLVFASFLAALMIASSHSADKKVFEINKLGDEVKRLNSERVYLRETVQELKLESFLKEKLKAQGLEPLATPPEKIIVVSTK